MEALKEWTAVAAFLVSMGIGFIGWWVRGQRDRWRIDQLGEAMARLEARILSLETQGRAEGITLASIGTTLIAMDRTLTEIKTDLKGKVDK